MNTMNAIRRLRFERGVTQRAVADATGLDRTTVIRLENSATPRPTATVAKALADYYGVTVDQLLGLEQAA